MKDKELAWKRSQQISAAVMICLFLLIGMTSCSKEEGDFGNTTIIGHVYKQELTSSGIVIREYYAPEERVYIIYGDNPVYDDMVRTSFDGSYKFDNLTAGDYRLFAYTACDTCASSVAPVFLDVVIEGGEDEIMLEDIIVTD